MSKQGKHPRLVRIVRDTCGHGYDIGTVGFVDFETNGSCSPFYKSGQLIARQINSNGNKNSVREKDVEMVGKGDPALLEYQESLRKDCEEACADYQYVYDTGFPPPTKEQVEKAKAVLETIKAVKADDEAAAIAAVVRVIP